METNVDNKDIKIDSITLQKMVLIFNALNCGWTVKKRIKAIFLTKLIKGKRKFF